MSQPFDSKIIELARKWGLKFIHYAELISLFNMEEWVVILSFIRALLNECSIVGRYYGYIYLRCDGKLVILRTTELYDYSKSVKVVEEEIKEIEQIKTVDKQELEKLLDNLPSASIDITKHGAPRITVLGDNAVHLMNLGDVPLYLGSIYMVSTSKDSRFGVVVDFLSQLGWGYVDVTYYVQKDGSTRYLGRAIEKIARETILRAIPHEGNKKEDEIVEEGVRLILSTVNEKYSIIDKMLEDAEDVFIKGLKELTAVFLY